MCVSKIIRSLEQNVKEFAKNIFNIKGEMSMKKLVAIVTLFFVVCPLFTFTGCGQKKEEEVELAVLDGAFNRKCTFSIDLGFESELVSNPLMLLLIQLCPDEDIKNELVTATKPEAYYESKKIYFLTDGTCIIAEKDSETMRKMNKLLDAAKSDEELARAKYTVGGYRLMPTEEENKYTLAVSGSTMVTYMYDSSAKSLVGTGTFQEEHFNEVAPEAAPDVSTASRFDYSAIPTGGGLEAKYMAMGEYEVLSEAYREQEQATYFQYKVWYPGEMENTDKKYPLIVLANGTGVIATAYEHVFRHLASWGFIVVGNDEANCNTGLASENSLALMLALNEDSSSKFYGKIDTDKIGSAGHSQGGVGAINAVTAQPHGDKYKAVFTASTTQHAVSELLGWPYDISKITVPYFAVAGTLTTDAGDGQENAGIAPLSSMQENHGLIHESVSKIFARRTGADHGEMLTWADGYMTAWFLWHLKGDEEARKAFYGEAAEILTNGNWQDVEKNF